MSSPEDRDIEPFDWFGRFFGRASSRRSGGFFGFPDVFRRFDEMRREMERGFENTFKNIPSTKRFSKISNTWRRQSKRIWTFHLASAAVKSKSNS